MIGQHQFKYTGEAMIQGERVFFDVNVTLNVARGCKAALYDTGTLIPSNIN